MSEETAGASQELRGHAERLNAEVAALLVLLHGTAAGAASHPTPPARGHGSPGATRVGLEPAALAER